MSSVEHQSPEFPDESPVISLPKEREAQLRLKLDEYRGRLDPTTHPDLLLLMGNPNAYRATILGKLLEAGSLRTHDLSLQMATQLGDKFNLDMFDLACGIIKDYCETGGTNTIGGTGLPSIKQ